jgi:hypothetical protein
VIGVRTVAMWTAERGAPKAELLPAAQRRRCSLLTRMIAEVVADLRTGGLAIADAPLVCGTGYGEIATTAALLEQMHTEEGGLSPIRFAGSVHNTFSCVNGQCVSQGCQPGYYDIDGNGTCEYACTFIQAQETCNGVDDNCNGMVDDNVVAPSPTQVCGASILPQPMHCHAWM